MDVSTGWEELAEKQEKEIQRLQGELDDLIHDMNQLKDSETFYVNELEITRKQLQEAVELLKAIETFEFGGIQTNDIEGKNWFDLRDETLAKIEGMK